MQDAYDSLAGVLQRLQARDESASRLLHACLARIKRHNPRLAALSDVAEERAQADAQRIDLRRQAGDATLGPLAGLPVVIKDLIDTTPMACAAGLPFLRDYRPLHDAAAVTRLRDAGAIVVGVATSDPGAFGVRTDATTHPQAPDRTVGGSSGGCAAALAAGFAFAALGTDTGGSVRIPAACCQIASLKPTFGRLPTDGVRPLSWSLDHVGTLARRAADLDTLQRVLDPGFQATRSGLVPGHARIGVDFDYFAEADSVVHDAIAQTLETCRAMGCRIVPVHLPAPDEVFEFHGTILFSEAAAYYETAGFADRDDLPALPRAGIALGRQYSATQLARAIHRRHQCSLQMQALWQQVDLLIAPTLPVLPPLKTETAVVLRGVMHDYTAALARYTVLFNETGNPVATVPVNQLGPGLGVSVQLVAQRHRDADAVAFAQALERRLAVPIDWTMQA